MEVKVTWQKRMSFVGAGKLGLTIPLDTSIEQGGDSSGFSPMELLLMGLAGCTAMDVISILEKKRQKVSRFEVRVNGQRASEHPKVFTNIIVEYPNWILTFMQIVGISTLKYQKKLLNTIWFETVSMNWIMKMQKKV